MPKDRGQEHRIDVPYPVTGTEVETLFRAASTRAPWPDQETCEQLAIAMSGDTAEGFQQTMASTKDEAWDQLAVSLSGGAAVYDMTAQQLAYRLRWKQAVKTLKATRTNRYSFPASVEHEKTCDIIETMLANIEKLLDAEPEPIKSPELAQVKDWSYCAIFWTYMGASVFQDLGRSGGTSRNSPSVKFAAAALERIGWRNENGDCITHAAIAGCYARMGKKGNDHNLTGGRL